MSTDPSATSDMITTHESSASPPSAAATAPTSSSTDDKASSSDPKSVNGGRTASSKETEFRIESAPYEKRLPSCAECRRLKRRCDRKWPCQSCIARGCASICPTGSLSTEGSGSRAILRKLREMSKRIGQLEDALSAVWTSTTGARTGEPHPLLKAELMKVKSLPDTAKDEDALAEDGIGPTGTGDQKIKGEEEEENVDYLVTELDTLTLGSHGKMNYMGRTAKLEFIIKAEELDPTRPTTSSTDWPEAFRGPKLPLVSRLPKQILDLSYSFLLKPPPTTVTLHHLREYLPPYPRARSMVDSYYLNAGWFYNPMPKEEFLDDIFSLFYPPPPVPGDSPGSEPERQHGAHDLAVLFMVLAVGSQLELDVPDGTNDEDSELFLTLARAAMGMDPLDNGCSMSLIQTLNIIIYRAQWDHQATNAEFLWAIMGVASKMSYTLGLRKSLENAFRISVLKKFKLDRDCERWDLPEKEINRRRYVFWELFSSNVWASIGSGRPPSLQLCYTDCRLPNDPSEKTAANTGKVLNRSFANYKHHFSKDCLWPIIEQNFNLSKTFNYAAVLALDRKVRDFDFGNLEREAAVGKDNGVVLQRWVNKNCKDHIILHMHRLFFTRALATHPDSPLDSPYSSSVLATFKCAVSLLQDVEVIYTQVPTRIVPIGLSWNFVLTSAMAMGSLASKGPRGPLAPVAFERLRAAVAIADAKFGASPRTAGGIPMIKNLMFAAQKAISAVQPGPTSTLIPPALQAHNTAINIPQMQPPIQPRQTLTLSSTQTESPLSNNNGASSYSDQHSPVAPQTPYDNRFPPQQGWNQPDYRPAYQVTGPPPGLIYSGHPRQLSLDSNQGVELQYVTDPNLVPPQAQPQEYSYATATLRHQPLYSFRPVGMPIRPDDFVWIDEPTEQRPLKRYRYEIDTSVGGGGPPPGAYIVGPGSQWQPPTMYEEISTPQRLGPLHEGPRAQWYGQMPQQVAPPQQYAYAQMSPTSAQAMGGPPNSYNQPTQQAYASSPIEQSRPQGWEIPAQYHQQQQQK